MTCKYCSSSRPAHGNNGAGPKKNRLALCDHTVFSACGRISGAGAIIPRQVRFADRPVLLTGRATDVSYPGLEQGKAMRACSMRAQERCRHDDDVVV